MIPRPGLQSSRRHPEAHAETPEAGEGNAGLAARLVSSRNLSLELAKPLTDEDQIVQSMDDASPTKWHLAHTTWFYEAFILRRYAARYKPFSASFDYCFNSYYETQGARHPRARRGLLTRPSASKVRNYRAHVDAALLRLLERDIASEPKLVELIELGINHEQQHQELLLTDILSLFARQPLRPAYQPAPHALTSEPARDVGFLAFDGGIVEIGHDGAGFGYDNEFPRHDTLLQPFRLADRCVTNGEWREFMADGSYRNPLLWLSDGWGTVMARDWQAPDYWEETEQGWQQMSLHGLCPIEPAAPVCHISYYEADAFARWAGKRLPTESEWEHAAGLAGPSGTEEGNTLGRGQLRPRPAMARNSAGGLSQLFGDVWEWTASAYQPYPGYHPPEGAIGEYNGKFMCSQQVLRGASCVTPDGHSRSTYRNFFYPHQRWQFMGLRLAEDA